MRIIPGKIQELTVTGEDGACYTVGDEENVIKLPKRDLLGSKVPGDLVEVFTFYNEQRELEATTKFPEIQLDEIGVFHVSNVNEFGAFIHIGTKRDILIPNREQREPLAKGQPCLVVLKSDEEKRRLYASTRLMSQLRHYPLTYQRGDEVDMIIAERMELGRRVVVNGKHLGVMFRNEMIRSVKLGEKMKGYVREIKGRDITVSMQKEGLELIDESAARIIEYLQANKGYMRLTDETDPEEIKLRLRMSKKTFKRAVGKLFKEGKVELKKFGVSLIESEEERTTRSEQTKNDEDRKRIKTTPRTGK